MQVLVRDNNVDQALKALKKKMQREGIFREMKLRNYFEKPSEKKAREKAEAVRRARKLARKKLQREGLLPGKAAAPARGGLAARVAGCRWWPWRIRRRPGWRRLRWRCWRRWLRRPLISRSLMSSKKPVATPRAFCFGALDGTITHACLFSAFAAARARAQPQPASR